MPLLPRAHPLGTLSMMDVFASDLPGQTVSQDWYDGMTPYVGLLGHDGADYLGLCPFAPLVAKSLGFTARVGDPKNAPLTT